MKLRWLRAVAFELMVVFLLGLSACSSSPKPTPQDEGSVKSSQPLNLAWSTKLAGDTTLNQALTLMNGKIAVASKGGHVHVVQSGNGQQAWHVDLKTGLNTGAGFDGRYAAVVTRNNELVAMEDGQVLWRNRLSAQSYTTPLVAGERVFLLLADRSVAAFDLATGQRLWVQQRAGEALVLRQNGVLMAFQNNLLAGFGGKLVALNRQSARHH